VSKFLSYKDTYGQELAYASLAACDGDLGEAVVWMGQAGYKVTEEHLRTIRLSRSAEIEQARARIAPKVEAALTSDLLDESVKLTAVIDAAVEHSAELLEQGRVMDPAKMARDLSQVRNQAIEKRMSLEGRPTSITEVRKPEEIIRALEAMGVATQGVIEATATEEEL
jgi:hypothetical protein